MVNNTITQLIQLIKHELQKQGHTPLAPKHITQQIIEHELTNTPWPWTNNIYTQDKEGNLRDNTNNIYYTNLAKKWAIYPEQEHTTLHIRTTHPTTQETRHTHIIWHPTPNTITINQNTTLTPLSPHTQVTQNTTYDPADPNFNITQITQKLKTWHTFTT